MNRQDLSFVVIQSQRIHPRFVRLVLEASSTLSPINAGQFVQVRVQSSLQSWLRIPLSIHYFDVEHNRIALLIQEVGEGSIWLASRKIGDTIKVLYPLGNGFKFPIPNQNKILFVGGGCGLAPLYGLLKEMSKREDFATKKCFFLTGAKTASDLLLQKEINEMGAEILCSTEDGSAGEKGFVTVNTILEKEKFDIIYTCGPTPMMKAISAIASKRKIICNVSLENKMACGIGACLCCVTPDKAGHNRCVCTEGPVFDASVLGW